MVLAAPSRSGSWTADPGLGVYVHIPFCKHRCHYCDFNTYEGQDALHDAYVEALIRYIGRWPVDTPPATTVFFGGGTPTLLAPQALGRIVDAVRERVGLVPGAEVTVEANPETVDERTFAGLLEAGFSRVSIGVQSTAARVLTGLGRTHSSQRALDAIRDARAAGFEDVNADLIYGSPWESPSDWQRSLLDVIAAEPTHVSAYALTVEEGTPLHTLVATGRTPDVDPDIQADRHATANELLGASGYSRYEVSNWARGAQACRHNLVYWCAGDYLAFGAGAHGHLDGRRWWNERLPRNFIDAVESGVTTESGHERLDADARAGEALMLGLRLTSGVHVSEFVARFGADTWAGREKTIDTLVGTGRLEHADGYLKVPESSVMLMSDIVARLL